MTGIGWFMSVIIGALAGWIAEKIMKTEHSLILNIILGIFGAIVLNWILFAVFGATLGGWIGQLVVAVVGACLLIAAGAMIKGRG